MQLYEPVYLNVGSTCGWPVLRAAHDKYAGAGPFR